MNPSRLTFIGVLLFAIIILAGCTSSRQESATNDPTAVAAAVEATLTAMAPTNQNNTPTVTPPAPDNLHQAPITLPPRVNGFNPAPRPASSKGDPNAPVIIYEWSDYT